MLFTLTKNELIKLMRKGKTWIVFGLFLIMVVGINVALHFSDQDARYYESPEFKVQQITNEIQWNKEELVKLEKEASTNAASHIKENIAYTNERIKSLEEQKKVQEEILAIGGSPDSWKKELAIEKKEKEEILKDTNLDEITKVELENRLKEINALESAGIKPIKNWEFGPFNNMIELFKILGSIILVAGIAIFMSDIVAGECTPPTLKFLLVQPISRTKMLASKFIAVVITVITMIVGLEALAFGAIGMVKGFDAGKMPIYLGQKYGFKATSELGGWQELVPVDGTAYLSDMSTYFMQSFGLQILFIIACCSFIFLISTLFKSSMIAMAVSVIISVAVPMVSMSIGKVREISHLIFLNYGGTPDLITGNIAYMYNNPNFSISLAITLMLITIIICPIIAGIIFKRKDILI